MTLQSDKQAAKVRRGIAVKVRQEMSEKLIRAGHSGVVLEDEFRHTLYRHLVEGLGAARQIRAKRSVVTAWVSLLRMSQWYEKAAEKVLHCNLISCFFFPLIVAPSTYHLLYY